MGPNRLQKYKSTKKYISIKVLITQPFFELLTSDFAWKFIWTVEPNDKVQKYKKDKSTKIQKYKVKNKNAKKYKKIQENAKNVKSTKYKNKKHLSASYWHNDKVQKYKNTKVKKHLSASY